MEDSASKDSHYISGTAINCELDVAAEVELDQTGREITHVSENVNTFSNRLPQKNSGIDERALHGNRSKHTMLGNLTFREIAEKRKGMSSTNKVEQKESVDLNSTNASLIENSRKCDKTKKGKAIKEVKIIDPQMLVGKTITLQNANQNFHIKFVNQNQSNCRKLCKLKALQLSPKAVVTKSLRTTTSFEQALGNGHGIGKRKNFQNKRQHLSSVLNNGCHKRFSVTEKTIVKSRTFSGHEKNLKMAHPAIIEPGKINSHMKLSPYDTPDGAQNILLCGSTSKGSKTKTNSCMATALETPENLIFSNSINRFGVAKECSKINTSNSLLLNGTFSNKLSILSQVASGQLAIDEQLKSEQEINKPFNTSKRTKGCHQVGSLKNNVYMDHSYERQNKIPEKYQFSQQSVKITDKKEDKNIVIMKTKPESLLSPNRNNSQNYIKPPMFAWCTQYITDNKTQHTYNLKRELKNPTNCTLTKQREGKVLKVTQETVGSSVNTEMTMKSCNINDSRMTLDVAKNHNANGNLQNISTTSSRIQKQFLDVEDKKQLKSQTVVKYQDTLIVSKEDVPGATFSRYLQKQTVASNSSGMLEKLPSGSKNSNLSENKKKSLGSESTFPQKPLCFNLDQDINVLNRSKLCKKAHDSRTGSKETSISNDDILITKEILVTKSKCLNSKHIGDKHFSNLCHSKQSTNPPTSSTRVIKHDRITRSVVKTNNNQTSQKNLKISASLKHPKTPSLNEVKSTPRFLESSTSILDKKNRLVKTLNKVQNSSLVENVQIQPVWIDKSHNTENIQTKNNEIQNVKKELGHGNRNISIKKCFVLVERLDQSACVLLKDNMIQKGAIGINVDQFCTDNWITNTSPHMEDAFSSTDVSSPSHNDVLNLGNSKLQYNNRQEVEHICKDHSHQEQVENNFTVERNVKPKLYKDVSNGLSNVPLSPVIRKCKGTSKESNRVVVFQQQIKCLSPEKVDCVTVNNVNINVKEKLECSDENVQNENDNKTKRPRGRPRKLKLNQTNNHEQQSTNDTNQAVNHTQQTTNCIYQATNPTQHSTNSATVMKKKTSKKDNLSDVTFQTNTEAKESESYMNNANLNNISDQDKLEILNLIEKDDGESFSSHKHSRGSREIYSLLSDFKNVGCSIQPYRKLRDRPSSRLSKSVENLKDLTDKATEKANQSTSSCSITSNVENLHKGLLRSKSHTNLNNFDCVKTLTKPALNKKVRFEDKGTDSSQWPHEKIIQSFPRKQDDSVDKLNTKSVEERLSGNITEIVYFHPAFADKCNIASTNNLCHSSPVNLVNYVPKFMSHQLICSNISPQVPNLPPQNNLGDGTPVDFNIVQHNSVFSNSGMIYKDLHIGQACNVPVHDTFRNIEMFSKCVPNDSQVDKNSVPQDVSSDIFNPQEDSNVLQTFSVSNPEPTQKLCARRGLKRKSPFLSLEHDKKKMLNSNFKRARLTNSVPNTARIKDIKTKKASNKQTTKNYYRNLKKAQTKTTSESKNIVQKLCARRGLKRKSPFLSLEHDKKKMLNSNFKRARLTNSVPNTARIKDIKTKKASNKQTTKNYCRNLKKAQTKTTSESKNIVQGSLSLKDKKFHSPKNFGVKKSVTCGIQRKSSRTDVKHSKPIATTPNAIGSNEIRINDYFQEVDKLSPVINEKRNKLIRSNEMTCGHIIDLKSRRNKSSQKICNLKSLRSKNSPTGGFKKGSTSSRSKEKNLIYSIPKAVDNKQLQISNFCSEKIEKSDEPTPSNEISHEFSIKMRTPSLVIHKLQTSSNKEKLDKHTPLNEATHKSSVKFENIMPRSPVLEVQKLQSPSNKTCKTKGLGKSTLSRRKQNKLNYRALSVQKTPDRPTTVKSKNKRKKSSQKIRKKKSPQIGRLRKGSYFSSSKEKNISNMPKTVDNLLSTFRSNTLEKIGEHTLSNEETHESSVKLGIIRAIPPLRMVKRNKSVRNLECKTKELGKRSCLSSCTKNKKMASPSTISGVHKTPKNIGELKIKGNKSSGKVKKNKFLQNKNSISLRLKKRHSLLNSKEENLICSLPNTVTDSSQLQWSKLYSDETGKLDKPTLSNEVTHESSVQLRNSPLRVVQKLQSSSNVECKTRGLKKRSSLSSYKQIKSIGSPSTLDIQETEITKLNHVTAKANENRFQLNQVSNVERQQNSLLSPITKLQSAQYLQKRKLNSKGVKRKQIASSCEQNELFCITMNSNNQKVLNRNPDHDVIENSSKMHTSQNDLPESNSLKYLHHTESPSENPSYNKSELNTGLKLKESNWRFAKCRFKRQPLRRKQLNSSLHIKTMKSNEIAPRNKYSESKPSISNESLVTLLDRVPLALLQSETLKCQANEAVTETNYNVSKAVTRQKSKTVLNRQTSNEHSEREKTLLKIMDQLKKTQRSHEIIIKEKSQ